MQVSENIISRRSIRKYKVDAPVSDEQIKLLMEAAMAAPSACDTRPWEFIVVSNREVIDKLADSHPFAKMLFTAPLAIVVCGIPEAQGGIAEGFFPQDCAAATQNILLQAYELGLGSCWCGVYPKADKVADLRKILDVPDNIVPFNIIAVGTPDESPRGGCYYDADKVKYIK